MAPPSLPSLPPLPAPSGAHHLCRRLTRATLLRTAAGAAGVAVLAACGDQNAAGGGLLKAGAPVEIEYWHTLSPANNAEAQGRMQALKLSAAANSQYVKIRWAQDAGSDTQKIMAGISAGTPPNLVVFRPNNGSQFYDLGASVDLETELKTFPSWSKTRAQLRQTFLDGASWRGKLVALPLYRVFQAMIYAPEHLERVGATVPAGSSWTWEAFQDLSKRAARPPDVWGLDVAWSYSGWQNWAGSNGVRWINKEQTKASFVQPDALAAVEFLANYTHGLQLLPPTAQGELLIKGQSVFEQQGMYRAPTLRQAGVRFEAIDMPRGPKLNGAPLKQGSMYSLIVFKSPDPATQRAAALLALGCLADDAQAEMCKIHLGLPITKSAEDSPAYKQYVAQDKQMKAFADMSPSVDVRPSFPSVEMMFTLMDTTMANIYAKKDSIQSALQAAQDQTQQWLDRDNAAKK
jgi:ABC-type glycerol-3-phosphate transport system substrate-binding protein